MLQYLPQLPLVVAALLAFIASASRIFAASKPFWSGRPAWFQMLAPQIALALGALGTGLAGGVKSWTDLTVVFVGAGALLLPGLPSNRSAAPLPSKDNPPMPPTAKPPTFGGIGPMGGALMALCLMASTMAGCAAFAAAVPIISEIANWASDASNDLSLIEQFVALFFAQNPNAKAQADINAAIAKCRQLIATTQAADSAAADLSQDQFDASWAAFRAAYSDLVALLSNTGVVPSGVSASANAFQAPIPLAVRLHKEAGK